MASPNPDLESPLEFRIALHDGRVDLAEVVHQLGERFGIKLGERLNQLDWTVNVQSIAGRLRLTAFERLTGGVICTTVKPDCLVVQVDEQSLRRRLHDADRKVEVLLSRNSTPHSTKREGLTFVTAEDAESLPAHAVVLVHGLDDPGYTWDDLLPRLLRRGYSIAKFEYRTDRPIAEAASMFARELEQARSKGLKRIDVVAHSMGGLLVREALTSDAAYAGDGSGADRYPALDHFIMVATPNHGSHMARFRNAAVTGELLYQVLRGRPIDAESAATRHGEAAVDLLPASDFLRRLNQRPLASHTAHTIIAGRVIPFSPKQVELAAGGARCIAQTTLAPRWVREIASTSAGRKVCAKLDAAVDVIGDGVVTIHSAQLKGVEDMVIVNGNHMSVLTSIGDGQRLPRAIPIILDRLTRDPSTHTN